MRLALLHRRLSAAMALAALLAFAAGFGLTSPPLLVAAGALTLPIFWRIPAGWRVPVERLSGAVTLVLFAWVLHTAFVTEGDFLIPVLALLLFLLTSEILRPIAGDGEPRERHDLRLYALSFALLVAATAYSPGPLFGMAFLAYVVAASLALMVGHLSREAERFSVADIPIGRPFLLTTAGMSATIVVISVGVFLLFPRLPRSLIGAPRNSGQQTMVGFSDQVSIAEFGSTISSNPEIVFRVEFPDHRPPRLSSLHWRGRSFDHFDGARWSHSRWVPPAPPESFYRATWGGEVGSYQIFGGPPGVRVLFGLHPVLDIKRRSRIRPFQLPSGDLVFSGGEMPVYSATSLLRPPPPQALRIGDAPDAISLSPYLQLPRLDPRVQALADSLAALGATRYDRAVAIERFFTEQFTYTLDLPRTRAEASLEHFLFERRAGHCEYFSTGMAVLLRAAGIPARNVNGFLGGEWNEAENYLAVTQNAAHSWVEVWFPAYGWVPFDPTPAGGRPSAGGGAGGASLGWSVRFWLDGIEHRWFKWVLFYDLDKQLDVLQGMSRLMEPPSLRMPKPAAPGSPGRVVLGALLAALLLAAVWQLMRRRQRDHAPYTRLYLQMRRSYAAAGWVYPPSLPPLMLLARLREEGAPGTQPHGPAHKLVGEYLAARFGNGDEAPGAAESMSTQLLDIRQLLRERQRDARQRRFARSSSRE